MSAEGWGRGVIEVDGGSGSTEFVMAGRGSALGEGALLLVGGPVLVPQESA